MIVVGVTGCGALTLSVIPATGAAPGTAGAPGTGAVLLTKQCLSTLPLDLDWCNLPLMSN